METRPRATVGEQAPLNCGLSVSSRTHGRGVSSELALKLASALFAPLTSCSHPHQVPRTRCTVGGRCPTAVPDDWLAVGSRLAMGLHEQRSRDAGVIQPTNRYPLPHQPPRLPGRPLASSPARRHDRGPRRTGVHGRAAATASPHAPSPCRRTTRPPRPTTSPHAGSTPAGTLRAGVTARVSGSGPVAGWDRTTPDVTHVLQTYAGAPRTIASDG